MDSGYEQRTRTTATTVAAPTTSVPSPRSAPATESAGPDITPVGTAPVDTTVDTGPIPVVAAPAVDTLVDTGPMAPIPAGPPPSDAPPAPAPVTNPCRCGHDRDVHEHFRRGTDCATCDCARFRGPGLLSRLLG
ncbi:hypothetical protein [Pseudonocardia endophytica]|uniref:Uncharacterized protein n=1 Tax=Pseudonocardia endophytica TaxID=401976 RepID=A0A4R1HGJ8_PSEEN|nr:hypothetical protein [Pseudonocardia endophytica]TCK21277.1 hypothetical protein EV378_5258 [Pseudonocardia endophytica]